MAPGTPRSAINSDIPEDIVGDAIFPRLPYKLVTCLKTLSKAFCALIKNDDTFATKQSKLCPLCPALIHIGRPSKNSSEYCIDVLSSTPAIVGIPSSRLDFLGCPIDKGNFILLGSSNGLLCISYKPYHIGPLTPPPTFLIANPAMQQAQPIPSAAQHLAWHTPLGLVFDPCDQPTVNTHKFQIIHAFPSAATHDTYLEFRFVIFSSDTGRWMVSDTRLNTIIKKHCCEKVVCTCGVMYWDYGEDLLWFDVTTNTAGVIKMPNTLQESTCEGWERHSIDASIDGKLMCITIDKDGLAIYQLVKIGDLCWELKHKNGWKDIMEMSGDAFQFCHSMKLRNAWQSKFHEKWFVRPLGLESGRWVYLGVRLIYKTSDRVLRYDMETGRVDHTGKELGNPYCMNCAFGYRNSMASIPRINVPISEDGICNGKSGGCICALEGSDG